MSSILFDKTHQQVLGVGADINCARARERERETVSRAPKCVMMCCAHLRTEGREAGGAGDAAAIGGEPALGVGHHHLA